MGLSVEEVIAAVRSRLEESGISIAKESGSNGGRTDASAAKTNGSSRSKSSTNPNSSSVKAKPELASNESGALIDRVLGALLAKAPKPYLALLEPSEFSEVVRLSSRSIERWADSPGEFFIETLSGGEFFYLTVVMKDCPFIINTFNNVLERLGIVEVVTLHPIVALRGMAASVAVLVFSGLDADAQTRVVVELKRTLPLLSRASSDFGAMTQNALAISERCLQSSRSLWTLDVAEFLRWLINGGFVFLGAVTGTPEPSKTGHTHHLSNSLGILAFDQPETRTLLKEIQGDYQLVKEVENFRVSKLSLLSPVHYSRRLLHVAVRDNSNGQIQSFVGTLTSRAISEEAASIPIVRLKLDELVRRSQVPLYGHHHKALVRLINSAPKHHLLMAEIDALASEVKMVQDVEFQGQSLARMSVDDAKRGVVTVLGFVSSRFHSAMRAEIQNHLERRLQTGGGRSDVYLTSLNDPVARMYFYTPLESTPTSALMMQLEEELGELALGWEGRFENALEREFGKRAHSFFTRYRSAFEDRYQALTSPADALRDIALCEDISESSPVQVRYDAPEGGANLVRLSTAATAAADSFASLGTISIVKLGSQLTLGQSLPILENLGLEVVDSETLELRLSASKLKKASEQMFLHRFFIQHRDNVSFDQKHFDAVVAPALEEILSGKRENDSLNMLLLAANLSTDAVTILRTYYHCLWQIRKAASRAVIRMSMTHNAEASALLWKLFEVKFDPALQLSVKSRLAKFDEIWQRFQDELKRVKDITEDAILKALGQLILHTVRTNFFNKPSHITHKIYSEKLPLLRGARPMFETFVYGPTIEGTHLRSSRVSRGGIRWSERREDYRTEVLALMRVQRIKNAIAVPAGAKGGFVLKESVQPITREAVVAGYKEYIRALLSVADNLEEGVAVAPEGLIIYDDPDPYLVVAADKGTASFSDYANQIAIDEYNFWLNDGFASGGSHGYGHKEFGITARGAWECVKQHFIELGLDYEHEQFTVCGIGDMSGDVFGNGLLLSKNMKLLAAFDHRHIFLDPDPQVETAFSERQRLFSLPRSSWADYDTRLISAGGGIFGRLDKDIQLSEESRKALGVPPEEVGPFNGEQIISFVLRAPVDLLWNGGIGTYVKGHMEVDSEVNDSANDAVRVNGQDLRARVVAEGGNVGFTQNGRIEYALRGGRINTDSIDNSAGVDLSDHEVNLKILFQSLEHSKACTRAERDSYFKQMGEEVSAMVRSHNSNQAFVISVAERASRKSLEYFRALIRELCERGYLTRTIDGLPSDDEIEKRALRRIGLTRPEIAVCLAGMKLWIKDELQRSGIAKDPALQDFLIKYFPTPLQVRFRKDLLAHPLAENITSAELANHLVDLVGITFVHRLQLTEGIDISDALRATIAASMVVGGKAFLAKIEVLNTFARRADFFDARLDLGRAVRLVATQFVHRFGGALNIADAQARYQKSIEELFEGVSEALPAGLVRASYEKYLQQREKSGLPAALSRELSFLHIAWLMLDASDLAQQHSVRIVDAHMLLIYVWEKLGLEFLVLENQSFGAKNKWEHELLMNSYDSLRSSVARIGGVLVTQGALKDSKLDIAQIKSTIERSPSYSVIKGTIAEFTTNSPEVSVLHALARHLENFRFAAV